jgi:outer membrane lipoprotein-sorting protein
MNERREHVAKPPRRGACAGREERPPSPVETPVAAECGKVLVKITHLYYAFVCACVAAVFFSRACLAVGGVGFEDRPQAPRADAAPIVAKLKNAYAGRCCFQANFDQVTVNISMDMKDHFTGMIYVKKPNLIAMEVETPEKQKVIIRGAEYTVFFPAEGNVSEGRIPPDMNMEHFFSFLADMSTLDERFEASVPQADPQRHAEFVFLELLQKGKPQSSYRILLGLDPKRFFIRRAVIYDALGNYNRFDLSNLTFPDDIPDARFTLGSAPNRKESGGIPFLDEKDAK